MSDASLEHIKSARRRAQARAEDQMRLLWMMTPPVTEASFSASTSFTCGLVSVVVERFG